MANRESDKKHKSSTAADFVDMPCFNCGNTVNMSVLRAEAMEQTGQVNYCYECNEEVDEGEDDGIGFIPFFE